MHPTPGFSNRVHGTAETKAEDETSKESGLAPYEFTLGDNHDTLPADDAPRVAPDIDRLKRIMTHLVEMPLERPEDN